MIRFITKIIMISTFFVGLGAIAEGVWKTVAMNKLECESNQFTIIKREDSPKEIYVDEPIEGKKIFIYRQE